MAVGRWGREAIEEPINDLIVYGELQPNLLKRMAIVGLPSFVLGSGTHVISRIEETDPTTNRQILKGFTATGTGGVLYIVQVSLFQLLLWGQDEMMFLRWRWACSSLDDESVEYGGKLDPEKYPPIRLPNGRMARNPEASKAQAQILIRRAQHARLVKGKLSKMGNRFLRPYRGVCNWSQTKDWAVIAYQGKLWAWNRLLHRTYRT